MSEQQRLAEYNAADFSAKFTVENCPAAIKKDDMIFCAKTPWDYTMCQLCSSRTDCIIKQLIGKCKETLKDYLHYNEGRVRFSEEILKLFKIRIKEQK